MVHEIWDGEIETQILSTLSTPSSAKPECSRVAFELPDDESSQDTNEGESSALGHGLFV